MKSDERGRIMNWLGDKHIEAGFRGNQEMSAPGLNEVKAAP